MWSIRQNGDRWEVVGPDVAVVETATSHDLAVLALGERVRAALAEAETDVPAGADGLLPERWSDAGAGIFFSTETGDGRDFTGCSWSWRDPSVSLLPLMLQTTTDVAHFGAVLAGFMEEVSVASGVGHAAGRFYDSPAGREARDLLLGGRHFGVSVDPGRVSAEWECTEEDDDGWCVEERVLFAEYEVIGLTMTPFPAFAAASITLEGGQAEAAVRAAAGELQMVTDHDFDDDGNGYCSVCVEEDEDGACVRICGATEAMHGEMDEEEAAAVAASAAPVLSIPLAPPGEWFRMAEPEPGSDLLVEQPDGGLACPLTIADDGRIFGHLARAGQCHVGFPGQCVTPPASASSYAHFHVGEVVTAEGERLAVGALTAGCDHAATRLRAAEAMDHYAHNGVAWADVRVVDGVLGPWACGALRPDVTPEQVRVLRASSLSGDWRRLGTGLDLIAALAVNVPGFPIAREALAASGLVVLPAARTRGAVSNREPVSLVAAGVVQRCAECQRRATTSPERAVGLTAEVVEWLTRVEGTLGAIERRTRHLRSPAAAALGARIRATTSPGQVNGREPARS